jgi:hypothetical protein
MEAKYRFLREEPGFCKVLYRDNKKRVFALADDGSWGKRKLVFYACSRDGEPSHEIQMPPREDFDRYVEP